MSDSFSRRVAAMYDLPLPEQGDCLLLAAEPSLPVWQEYARTHGIDDLSEQLVACFRRWRESAVASTALDRVAQRFLATLPQDLRELPEPAGGYAGWALLDVALVALGQGEDAHPDLLYIAPLYAAAAFRRVNAGPAALGVERLTEGEREFLEHWWGRCAERFPRLAALLSDPAWTPWYARGEAYAPPGATKNQ